jgi:hypothetical protein
MFWNRKSHIKTLEDRLDRVAHRQCANEILLAVSIALVLRTGNERQIDRFISELRWAFGLHDFLDQEQARELMDLVEDLARAEVGVG